MLRDDVQLISVDDHVIEHERVWLDRLPSKYRESGPHIVEVDGGKQVWKFEDRVIPTIGLNAVAGKDPKDFGVDPVSFDEMLPGCYDVTARLADMDLDGVHAQMCFPSFPGFAGGTFFAAEDKELAAACVVAWNDFILDEWSAAAPDRFIPMVMVPFWDVAASVAEVERTAAKGAKAITFTEAPHRLGLPSFHGDHWDPFLAAAQAADMPLCLHFGTRRRTRGRARRQLRRRHRALRDELAVHHRRHAAVPGLPQIPAPAGRTVGRGHRVDALRARTSRLHVGAAPLVHGREPRRTALGPLPRPHLRLFHRRQRRDEERGLIGVDNIMFEGDYPHGDNHFPASRKKLAVVLFEVPDDEARKIAEDNARRVFNFGRSERVMTRPFEGVRVLEVAAWTFVPAAGAALADLGADVIKVEPPNGDPQRGLMNLLGSADRPGPNPFIEIPNRGKRGISIDLSTVAAATSSSRSRLRPTSSSRATCRRCGRSLGSNWRICGRPIPESSTSADMAGARTVR